MCMYAARRTPFVAQNDIVCVKVLEKIPTGYKTPCRNMIVKLNTTIEPENPGIDMSEERYCTSEVNGGVIHGLTYNQGSWGDNGIFFKAIIPKGTKYWISLHGKEIVAEAMIVTDKTIDISKPDISLLKDMLAQAPSVNNIHIGDLYIKDEGFVHALELTEKPENVVAIVVGFKPDGSPLLWSGEEVEKRMDTQYNSIFDETVEDPSKDWDGEKHLKAFKEKYAQREPGRFEAYDACLQYKPEVGEWYIPAGAEQQEMLKNIAYINAVSWLLFEGTIKVDTGYYWTSSEYSTGRCWCCNLGSCCIDVRWGYRGYYCYVCFFLASTSYNTKVKLTNRSTKESKKKALKGIIPFETIMQYVRRRKA